MSTQTNTNGTFQLPYNVTESAEFAQNIVVSLVDTVVGNILLTNTEFRSLVSALYQQMAQSNIAQAQAQESAGNAQAANSGGQAAGGGLVAGQLVQSGTSDALAQKGFNTHQSDLTSRTAENNRQLAAARKDLLVVDNTNNSGPAGIAQSQAAKQETVDNLSATKSQLKVEQKQLDTERQDHNTTVSRKEGTFRELGQILTGFTQVYGNTQEGRQNALGTLSQSASQLSQSATSPVQETYSTMLQLVSALLQAASQAYNASVSAAGR